MYAETDFYLALLKEQDWLKETALGIYARHKKEIWTSQITTQELMLYAYKHGIRPVAFLDSFYELAEVVDIELNRDFFLLATHIMEKYGATPYDAMHAVVAAEDGTIISSDGIYDRIGLRRIPIGEKE